VVKVVEVVKVVKVVIFRPTENVAEAKSFFDASTNTPSQLFSSARILRILWRRHVALSWFGVRWSEKKTSHVYSNHLLEKNHLREAAVMARPATVTYAEISPGYLE
jgi:hypothetical protein